MITVCGIESNPPPMIEVEMDTQKRRTDLMESGKIFFTATFFGGHKRLFMVTPGCIICMDNPAHWWNDVVVTVHEWVDVTITVEKP